MCSCPQHLWELLPKQMAKRRMKRRWMKERRNQTDNPRWYSSNSSRFYFPVSSLLSLCLFQTENQLPVFKTFYNFTSKLNEHIISVFMGLKMVSKISLFIIVKTLNKTHVYAWKKNGLLMIWLSHHRGKKFFLTSPKRFGIYLPQFLTTPAFYLCFSTSLFNFWNLF